MELTLDGTVWREAMLEAWERTPPAGKNVAAIYGMTLVCAQILRAGSPPPGDAAGPPRMERWA
jgi:hypothetical protein